MRLLAGIRFQKGLIPALLVSVCLIVSGPAMARKPVPPLKTDPYAGEKAGEKAEVSTALDQQMDFGQVADNDGSVVLGLSDAITSDPSFIHYGGSPYSAICTITGDANTAVDVSITTVASNGLSLSAFTSNEGAIPLIGTSLDGTGELVLTIGATLTVDAALATTGSNQTVSYTIITIYN